MATRWGIALCVLLALFASSVSADVFDDVASFVKDSEAVENFKGKLFDEDYVQDVVDKLKVVDDKVVYDSVSSETTEPNAFPMLFEGTVLNDFTGVKEKAPVVEAKTVEAVSVEASDVMVTKDNTSERASELDVSVDEPKQEQEQEQIFDSLQAALENSAAEFQQREEQTEDMVDEQTEALAQELEQALDQEEGEQEEMQLELEKFPVAIINFLQDAVEAVATEQDAFETIATESSVMPGAMIDSTEEAVETVEIEQEPQPCEGMTVESEMVDEYCASAVKTCEMETCANQPVTENRCEKTEEGYQTACACGEASSNSISFGDAAGSFSSSSSGFNLPGSRGMPEPPIDFMREMFARRFGPRPTFSQQHPQVDVPRGVPHPLMSLIGGMPSFRMAPKVMSIEFSNREEEQKQEQGPTEVDLSELQQGAGMFPQPVFRPLAFVRALPVRFSMFRQMPEQMPEQVQVPELRIMPSEQVMEEPPAFIKAIISNMINNIPEEPETEPVPQFEEPQSDMYLQDPNSIQSQVNDMKKEGLKKEAWLMKEALKKEDANWVVKEDRLKKEEWKGKKDWLKKEARLKKEDLKKEDVNWGEKEDWLKKEEWKAMKEGGWEKKEGGWRYGDNYGGGDLQKEVDPHHPPAVLCFLVMACVVLMATLTCCACARRPRSHDDGEHLMVDVVGVDGYTPLMNTSYEQETNPEMKPLMPLDFEEPIKAQVN